MTGENVLLLAMAGYAGMGLFLLFVSFERRGRPELVLAVIVGALVAQLAVYAVDADVPVGPFRPGPLRLPELLILAGVSSRLWVRGVGQRVTATGMAWALFVIWYAAESVTGVSVGHPTHVALFHARFAVYIAGGYILASGVPTARLVSRHVFGWWLAGASGFASVQFLDSLLDVDLLGAASPADIGADTSSFYLGLGLVVVLLEASRRGGRAWIYLAMIPFIASPLVVAQRASVVHLAASAMVLAVVVTSSTWRRQMAVQLSQLVLAAGALLLVVLVVSLPRFSTGEVLPEVVEETLDETFEGTGNQQSADARILKWREGWEQFREKPVLGSGLGTQFVSFRPGIRGVGEFEKAEVFDSILLDLLVRSGLVGFVLFSVAMMMSIRDSWAVWRRHPDPSVAALGLGILLYLVGFVAKGVVESILDKVVLACLLGLAVGVVASARAELRGLDDGDPEELTRGLESRQWS